MKYVSFFVVMIICSSLVAQDGSNWINSFKMTPISGAGKGSATVTVIGSSPDCFSQQITGEFSDGVLDLMLFEKERGACHLDLRFVPLTLDFQIDTPPDLIRATRVITDNGTSDGTVLATHGPFTLEELAPHIPGDANVDKVFNSGDLVSVFAAGEYEDRIDENSTWFSGDWNGDREFDTSDLVLAFRGGAYEPPANPAIASAVSVPEPSSLVGFVFAISVFFARRRQ